MKAIAVADEPASTDAHALPPRERSGWLRQHLAAFALGPRSANMLIAIMLALKLIATAWNAYVYDALGYDYEHHANRALVGGLEPGKMNYDPPLYYLPSLLFATAAERKAALKIASPDELRHERDGIRKHERDARAIARVRHDPIRAQLIADLRTTNVLYIALFYLCWCCVSLRLLLPGWRSWFLASALLLVLPGYQKLGVMAHADNLFAAASALCTAVWLSLHARWRAQQTPIASGACLLFAFAIGLVGLTRPFAVVPVAVFTLVACAFALRGRPLSIVRAAARVVAVVAIIGAMSVSWYAYRWTKSKALTEAYKDDYIEQYLPARKTFDLAEYLTSFYFTDLVATPNRGASDKPDVASAERGVSNSFFTLLYSETWGDHWLYFSGDKGTERKLWAKRILFVLALPVPFLWAAGVACSVPALLRRARQAWAASTRSRYRALDALAAIEREAIIAVWLVLAAALYLYWQTGAGLLPGKNSTVKFIYVATFYPLAIALACAWRPPRAVFELCAAYLIGLYVIAFPVALFPPTSATILHGEPPPVHRPAASDKSEGESPLHGGHAFDTSVRARSQLLRAAPHFSMISAGAPSRAASAQIASDRSQMRSRRSRAAVQSGPCGCGCSASLASELRCSVSAASSSTAGSSGRADAGPSASASATFKASMRASHAGKAAESGHDSGGRLRRVVG